MPYGKAIKHNQRWKANTEERKCPFCEVDHPFRMTRNSFLFPFMSSSLVSQQMYAQTIFSPMTPQD